MEKLYKINAGYLLICSIFILCNYSIVYSSQHEIRHKHTTRPEGKPAFTCSICGKIHNPSKHPGTRDCCNCDSRPRARTLPYLISKILKDNLNIKLAQEKPILAFSASNTEIDYLKKYFAKITSVSLYGKYGKDGKDNIDLRDLSKYEEKSFSAVYSMCVYDYFLEHEKAISEAYRVLAPGAVLITQIMTRRLKQDNSPPSFKSFTKSKDNYMSYIPRDVKITTITVGKKWYVNAMNNAGFTGKYYDIYDEISGENITWFIGKK